MYIRKATAQDIDDVEDIYRRIHEQEAQGAAVIGWKAGVYPIRQDAQEALERNDLYVAQHENTVVAAAIINHIQPPGYEQAAWSCSASDEEVLVLHTLVVHPGYSGQGFAGSLIAFYEEMAQAAGCKCVRIDTNARNVRARTIYAHLGYREVSIIPTSFNGIESVQLVCLEKMLDGRAAN